MASVPGNLEEKQTNFLRQFRDSKSKQFKKFTATQFSEVWNHYDQDGKKSQNLNSIFFKLLIICKSECKYKRIVIKIFWF